MAISRPDTPLAPTPDSTSTKSIDEKIAAVDSNKRINKIVEKRYAKVDKKYDKAGNDTKKIEKIDKKFGYNYEDAKKSGMEADSTGHWGSIGNDGLILKGKKHPSMIKTKKVEKILGNKIKTIEGKQYSIPKKK